MSDALRALVECDPRMTNDDWEEVDESDDPLLRRLAYDYGTVAAAALGLILAQGFAATAISALEGRCDWQEAEIARLRARITELEGQRYE